MIVLSYRKNSYTKVEKKRKLPFYYVYIRTIQADNVYSHMNALTDKQVESSVSFLKYEGLVCCIIHKEL